MKRWLTIFLSLVISGGVAFADGPISFPTGGGTGSGTTNASDLSSGLVATARGGTNKDSSGSTGTPYVLSGTWTFDNAATALGRLGISAVENTALSTWAGTTNVTTLGTIGTGTWNADVIGKAMGGFGASIASQTGIPTWATGTITWNSWAAFLLQTGIIYNPADNTWIFPASITATEYVSTAADNTRGVTVPNTADPTGANLAAGKVWVTDNVLKVRNNDNTATLQAWTSGGASSLAYATTGTLNAAIKINSDADGMTGAEMTTANVYGSLFLATGAGTWTLPTAAVGMSVCVMDSGTAHDIIVDIQAGDNVVLVGVEGADGVGITNASGSSTGDYVCLVAAKANKWYVMGKQGTWASQ